MEARRGDIDRQQQRPPPQTCPRCESKNTKFCYFNNNRTTQPRYFCKTCRRYWTHGGTQRNIPVGGGGRKEKPKKVSSSSNGQGSLRSSVTSLPLPPQSMQISQNVSSNIATIQTLNLTPPLGTTRPLSLGANQMGGSGYGNTSLLQGFLMGSTMRPQQTDQVLQIQQPNNFHMGNHGKEPLPSFDQHFSESMRSSGSWNQSWFANNKNNVMTTSSSTFWNYNSNVNINNVADNNMLESSLSPNEWSDLPDYGPPEF